MNTKAKRIITINVFSVDAAAHFEVENNPYKPFKTFLEAKKEILKYVRAVYDSVMDKKELEYTFVGTASFLVQFYLEDDSYGVIEVLVHPSVGSCSFTYVNEYLEQEGV